MTPKATLMALAVLAILVVPAPGGTEPSPPPAQPPTAAPAAEAATKEAPRPTSVASDHAVQIGGQGVAYSAVVGTVILRDEKHEPTASLGYVAYLRKEVQDASRRPITFAFNGGPGASSVWLHMGALGPRRIRTADAHATPPPPYEVVDNAHSLLDVSDLVLVDPVGTGVSHAVGAHEDKEFWGVDPDIRSVSDFIVQYVTDHDRWLSPKYLLGESYGTTRAAGVVSRLQAEHSMAFNGVILVSLALDIGAIHEESSGHDLPYAFHLPTMAAVAWYHRALPERPERLEPWLDEVRAYAFGPYLQALMKGDRLPAAELGTVAAALHRFTGLPVAYLQQASLRVRSTQFAQELLRDRRATLGQLDGRFAGLTSDPLAEDAEYDPADTAVSAAFVASFMDYYHRELGAGRDRSYVVGADVWDTWSFTHKVAGHGGGAPQAVVNTGADLAAALVANPDLHVLALAGLYDLVTPFAGAEYMLSHLGVGPTAASRIHVRYYEAGHMMYLHEPTLARMKADIAGFVGATSARAATSPPESRP